MQDHELCQRIARGIAPWTVGEINVESAAQRLEVQVECDDAVPKQCPHCDCMLLVCDHGEEQTWRQPDDGPWQIFLMGRLPLIECPEHGVVRVSPPWADWYVRGLDKSLLGPWSLQQLKLLLDAGRISSSTLLKRSSSDKWVITGTVSALFVKQDETVEPPLTVHELAAVDWAIANAPEISMSIEATASDLIAMDFMATDGIATDGIASEGITTDGMATYGNATDDITTDGDATGGNVTDFIATWRKAWARNPSRHSDAYRGSDSHEKPRRDRQTKQPPVTGVNPAGKDANPKEPEFDDGAAGPKQRAQLGNDAKPGPPEFNLDLRLLEDSDRDAVRDSQSSLKPSHPSVPREPEKPPATRREQSPAEWNKALEKAVEMEHKAKVVREKPVDDPAALPVKAPSRRDALVRRRGFQQGYQLLTMVYLINACLVSCLIPAVCMIFFSRLLLLSTSVFAPFEGGNELQEGQLVECGLSALSLLVLIGFPVWHLMSNDGILWHYVPSALLGMTVGVALSPDYLDEVCAALQWCQFGFGIATVGLTVYTLSAVPARSRMSLPMIAAGLLTALSAMLLFCVRSGSMLSVQADAIPPQFRGALPDALLYVFGLAGTLVFIPGAILFELYRHTNFSTRQFIIRTGVMLGVYLLAGCATLGTFVHGAGSGFFDVPLALLPLGCINALAAAIPSALLLVNPQFTVSQD